MFGTVLGVGHIIAEDVDTVFVMEPSWCHGIHTLVTLVRASASFPLPHLQIHFGRQHPFEKEHE